MRINNYLLGFTGILTILTVSHFFVVFKYFQLLIHHSIYYCQEMVKALSLGLPGDLGKVAFGILMLASLFTLIRLLRTIFEIYSFRKTLSETKTRKDVNLTHLLEKLNLREKVKIVKQMRPQAFCFGVFNPRIYISTGLLKLMRVKELEVILRHEKYHLESRDPFTMLLAAFIESLFPFFPILSDFIKIYRTDREVKADQFATYKTAGKKSLSLVLKRLLNYKPIINPAFIPGIISADTLEARIQSLLSLKTSYKTIGRRNLFISLVSVIALVGLMVTPVNAIEIHEEGHDVVMLCNQTSTCESVCREHTLMQHQSSSQLYTPVNFTSAN
ncbi:hypothetical protein A2872_04205 [Candidatus Gottesmanbacteria bacterium RIFCSPHIGHO2_01_FULL_42_12]|uniref:Peptidase M56 domain-containing protein n=1 Tax=Candidatus Gottesmanbacteria bacterium RIFCSPHIGHO2_01_FULL_42_12 TaxID=1798377 RepID=A0A1F5Z1A5_9BACT|nr:MAG: hypothetical protein A2872_04205 [Candidatus Gottesmanbacteria bacterium RIFCSPHIGHO2_01_FULL_42_12]